MGSPISVDLPHKLGAAEARRRIQNGIGGLDRHLPAGARAEHHWSGERMNLKVVALGQEVSATIDVEETYVRVQVQLPPFLSFFGSTIEGLLRRHGTELLEDRSGGRRSG
ncbi:hypothetical protein E2493_10160 [Sphingomonas parva]|uniref:Polyhydroxyalkanoic acid synthase n=1 Tax=Sphingomonas parva TaxID=2555898 RepID=A0A4Y8ZQP8_9SPHN|nr:polyhydroxyalkanoic acid system family protein [Sphingomonas parva]TFI58341.1 hypothetical protein E2493_10160 [Sphingomonas parva]